jgi:hypothetical protein
MNEIILKCNIEDLREIFFGSGNHRYFFGPETKRQSLLMVLAIILFPFFAIYAINLEEDYIFIFGSILFVLPIYDFWRVSKPIFQWKKSVEKFLINSQKIKDLRFKYNEEYFIHIQDKTEKKMNWTEVVHATINDRLIEIHTTENFLLPKKAMTAVEFENLSKIIMNKVKNVIKE